ncbi:hypothetical protein [Longilinea arvoryzae]|nr:hypothetical protein [Longilinea arvoryzae]
MSVDGYDNRSAFIRGLIRQEYARRYSRPNSLVTVADALRTSAGDALRTPAGETQSTAQPAATAEAE